MESTHPFSVSFAPCFQAVLCRSRLFFRMFLDKLFQICADRFIMKQKWRCFSPFLLSPSSRRAWIEIDVKRLLLTNSLVALLAEGVDRNKLHAAVDVHHLRVALLAEGVDRNLDVLCIADADAKVALLAEGVDRNPRCAFIVLLLNRSPSSRRAWIEIPSPRMQRRSGQRVALLAEGVDRNCRRGEGHAHGVQVALLAEGVDRNNDPFVLIIDVLCRPPRGGRG